MNKTTRNALLLAGLVLAGRALVQKRREADLTDQVVLITGGSRGLGLALAEEFGKHGTRLALCARDAGELQRVRETLAGQGINAHTVVCDLTDPAQAARLIADVTAHYGQVDILVNNAGIIEVGPVQNMARSDFEDALAVDFWGVLDPILAVLPQMRARKSGRIVNVTSIGGKVAFPHLLPYVAAKFAATGLSEGLHAELARDGITVTTIVPGLMRTGSYGNALFKGDKPAEYAWFSLGDNLPGGSISAEHAAREIVTAARRGEAERILSIPANLLARLHGLAPAATSGLLTLVNNLVLPPPTEQPGGYTASQGKDVAPDVPVRPLFEAATGLGRAAAERLNQNPEG
jgi:NAD(P)-dependent dehydrogenase (short-subunit alcohol dehydrogenase family)